MSFWIAKHGHEVMVITTPPCCPNWKFGKGYRTYWWSSEPLNGVKDWRCQISVPKKPTGPSRLFHLCTFAMTSWPITLFYIFWRPAVVITIEPPLFTAPAALITSFFVAQSLFCIFGIMRLMLLSTSVY